MPNRTFETNEQAYNAIYNIFLERSRTYHRFPKVRDIESSLKIHMKTYKINPREIKVKVIKQRLDDVYSQNLDPSENEVNKLLGVGIWRYLEDLRFECFSELRESYVNKKTRRKFATKKEALDALKSKVKEMVINREYKSKDDAQKIVGTNIATYGIRWKEEVLCPVYGDLIKEEFEKNPTIGDEEIREKFSFAQSFLKNQGGVVLFKIKNKIPIRKREESMLLRRLILQTAKPKPEQPTNEEYMWNFIRQTTGKAYDTFRIPQEIEYLKRNKKIEGGKLNGGYWRVE